MSEHTPKPNGQISTRKRTASRRVRHACDLLISGECKTITAAAKRAGLSRCHLSRTLRTPHGQSFWTQRARETIHAAGPIAANRLVELLHGESEHVAAKAAIHILATEGIRPPEQGAVQINSFSAGYIINLRSSRDETPLTDEEQLDLKRQLEATGGAGALIGRSNYSKLPAHDPLTIEHQREGGDGNGSR